jgi:hypothetical protein
LRESHFLSSEQSPTIVGGMLLCKKPDSIERATALEIQEAHFKECLVHVALGSLRICVLSAFTNVFGLLTKSSDDRGRARNCKWLAVAVMVSACALLGGIPAIAQSVSSSFIFSTLAGNGTPSSVDGQGLTATLNVPYGVAMDRAGNIFVAEYGASGTGKVRMITPAGCVITVAGSASSGKVDATPATSGSLNRPRGVALDSGGNLYIADTSNNLIRLVTPDPATGSFIVSSGSGCPTASPNTTLTTIAGKQGLTAAANYSGAVSGTKLAGPFGIAVDNAGSVYFSDQGTASTGNVIRKIVPVSGDPLGLAHSLQNGAMSTVAGLNGANGTLSKPLGIAVDRAGNILYVENGNMVVRKLTGATSDPIVAGTVSAIGAYTGDGGAAIGAGLKNPTGIAFDNAGNLYISDQGNNVIRKVDKGTGIITTVAGGGAGTCGGAETDSVGDGCPAVNGKFVSGSGGAPAGVAVDSAGNLYISDYNGNDIRKATAQSTNFVSVNVGAAATRTLSFDVAPGTTIGSVQVSTQGSSTGDFQPLSGGELCSAHANPATATAPIICTVGVTLNPATPGLRMGAIVFYDGSSNVVSTTYISGTGVGPMIGFAPGTISKFSPASTSPLSAPGSMAQDGAGNLYAISGNSVLKGPVPISNLPIGVVPAGVAVDGSGNLYIADSANNIVLKVAPTGYVTTVAGTAGTSGSTGDGGPAAGALLHAPSGVAVDANGNLYIADSGNDVIRKVNSAGIVSSLSVSPALNAPAGVAVDAAGNLYTLDKTNNVILKIDAARNVTTVAGGGPNPATCAGSSNAFGDGCLATSAVLNAPVGVAVSSKGNLYIADSDSSGSLVRKVDVSNAPSLTFADTNVGSASAAQDLAVENLGNSQLHVSSISINPDFNLQGYDTSCATASQVLDPAGSCVLGIEFAPQSAVNYTASSPAGIILADNSLNASPDVQQTIALIGKSTSTSSVTLSPTTLPGGTVNASYSQTIAASGGVSPYSYAVTTGLLPAGLTLSSAGVVAGTPTTAGTSTFTVTATDSSSGTALTGSQSYTVAISPALSVTLSPTTLPGGAVNASYSQTITASGGTAPYTYSVTGTLPSGLTLTGGTLSGTPTTAGTFTFTVTATDSASTTGTQSYTVTISPATLTLTPTTLPGGTVNASYSQAITANGGVAPYTYVVVGSLPAGLTLSSGGVLSGTPTTASGSPFTFTVTATDSSSPTQLTGTQNYSVTILPAASLTITPASLGTGTVGTNYSKTITASGGLAPYSYAVATGTLPPGVTLNSTTGALSGTPTTAGTYPFTVTATDSTSPTPLTGTQSYTVTISAAAALSIGSVAAPTTTGSYSKTITATGGVAPYTYAVTSGSLPTGLTLDLNTGILSGTITTTGSYNFTVTATDSTSPTPLTGTKSFSWTVGLPALSLSNTNVSGTINVSFSKTITASNGVAPYTYSVTLGSLPTGLTLDPNTGILSGTPTTAGSYPITVTATDSTLPTPATVSKAYTVTIANALTLSPTLPGGTVGASYSQQITASGGTAPYTYTVTTGTLPTGLVLSSSGLLSGTPTSVGSSTFTVKATDSTSGTAITGSQSYTVVISAAGTITVSPASLPGGAVNVSYAQTITASGGTAPYAYAVSAGTLPAGLTLSSTGLLSGTPTTAGSSTFTVTATDSTSATGSQSYTVTILAAPSLTLSPTTLPGGTVGTGYTQAITASGGVSPYTYAVAGNVPAGLALTGGTLSGTPTAAGTFTFSVTATDSTSPTPLTGTKSYTMTISAAAGTLALSPTTLPSGTVGTGYTQTITASGGVSPYTYSVAGNLPAGLTLTGSTLSGTPTAAGTFTFSVTAADSTSPTPLTGTISYTVTISGAPATITISGPSSGNYGSAVTLTATVTPAVDTNAVTWNAGTSTACSVGSTNGIVTVTSGTGTCSITATVAGDNNYATATSAAFKVTVGKSTAATVAVTGPVSLTYGTTGTATATVAPADDTGRVSFSADPSSTGCTVSSTKVTVTNALGTCFVTASVASDSNYAAAGPSALFQVAMSQAVAGAGGVNPVTVASSLGTSSIGQAVIFTASLPTGATGTVDFQDNGSPISGCTGVPVSNGKPTCTTSALAIGTHQITVVYSGDNNYAAGVPGDLGTVTQIVTVTPDFTLTANGPTSQMVIPGKSATYTFTITPTAPSYPGPVILSATGLPPGASYALSQPGSIYTWLQLNLAADAGTQSITLKINTTQQNVASASRKSEAWPAGGGAALALVLLPLGLLRRGRRLIGSKLFLILLAVTALVATTGLVGCGAHGGLFGQVPKSYPITLTATSGTTTHTVSVNLNVQ